MQDNYERGCELLKNHVPLDVVTTYPCSLLRYPRCELLKNHVPLDVVTTFADEIIAKY